MKTRETRIFCGSVCFKLGDVRYRFQMSPAEIHGGPRGKYRIRLNRRWLDDEDGRTAFYDTRQLWIQIAEICRGAIPRTRRTKAPTMPVKSRCSVRYEQDGIEHVEGSHICTPPIMDYRGMWMVAVYLYGKGTVFVPCFDVKLAQPQIRQISNLGISQN